MLNATALNPIQASGQLAALQGTGSARAARPAEDAFAALFQQAMSPQSQAQTAAIPGQSRAASDFSALGQALSSGNLAAAQQAYQALQTDLQGTRQAHHHHHHHHGASGAETGASTQASASAPASAPTSASGSSTDASPLLALLQKA